MSDEECSNDDANVSYQPRTRNVLTLEERVAAIRQYEFTPMYSKVAKTFNCSWEQIKGIIANRENIMEFYEATRRTDKCSDLKDEELRGRKLNFLSHCLYEYIQRVQYHQHVDINEELLRNKVQEFQELMRIENFKATKSWINHFKAAYNITLSNRQITLTRRPPRSLELPDIMSYCGKQTKPNQHAMQQLAPSPTEIAKVEQGLSQQDEHKILRSLYRTKTQAAISSENGATLEEMQQRRKRKINFLEKALYEYVKRSQVHHKGRLDMDNLRSVAISLRDILKIDNFFPDKSWFAHFRSHYNLSFSQGMASTNRRMPLSLDLRDIVSYCSRHEQRDLPAHVTLLPKEQAKKTSSPPPLVLLHKPFVEPKQETVQTGNNVEADDDCIAIDVPTELIEIKDDDDLDNTASTSTRSALKRKQAATVVCELPLKIQIIDAHQAHYNQQQQQAIQPVFQSENRASESLPSCVASYAAALRLLKPIEDFVLLQENYRAIGLIQQLEKIFIKHIQ